MIIKGLLADPSIDLVADSSKFEETIGYIVDEIEDVCSPVDPKDFDNPLVLSFLSNFTLSGCYLPDFMFTKQVLDKLTFSRSNQLQYLSTNLGS